MNAYRCNAFARFVNSSFTGCIERRFLLGRVMVAGAAVLGGAMLPEAAPAKKKKRSKKSKGDLCLSNGSRCTKQGKRCKAGNCLQTPFTIEAKWTNPDTDHDTYVFVPNAPGASLPFPYFNYTCRSSDAGAGQLEPFAYVSQDARGPGDEVTTVAFLLDGKYEYWIDLDGNSPAGDLTIDLRNKNGQVVRSWSSPANPSTRRGWHVFDIQGERKSLTSVNRSIDVPVIPGAHAGATSVCP